MNSMYVCMYMYAYMFIDIGIHNIRHTDLDIGALGVLVHVGPADDGCGICPLVPSPVCACVRVCVCVCVCVLLVLCLYSVVQYFIYEDCKIIQKIVD